MNDELQTTLNDALVSVIESTASAKEFILAETPEVIEQLLMWEVLSSLVWFFAWIVVASVFVFYTVRAFRNAWDFDGIMFLTIASACSLIGIASSLTWLKIMIAPKLYLLEYAAELVK